jgi:hypothetical protein
MQTKMIALPADSATFEGSQVHNWTGLTVGNKHTEKRSEIISEKALQICIIIIKIIQVKK